MFVFTALPESKSDSEESDEDPELSSVPSALVISSPTISCLTATSLSSSGSAVREGSEDCPNRRMSDVMKLKSHFHCSQMVSDETPEPSLMSLAISHGNPTTFHSVSPSGGILRTDSDVPLAQPTMKKCRIPCMF